MLRRWRNPAGGRTAGVCPVHRVNTEPSHSMARQDKQGQAVMSFSAALSVVLWILWLSRDGGVGAGQHGPPRNSFM